MWYLIKINKQILQWTKVKRICEMYKRKMKVIDIKRQQQTCMLLWTDLIPYIVNWHASPFKWTKHFMKMIVMMLMIKMAPLVSRRTTFGVHRSLHKCSRLIPHERTCYPVSYCGRDSRGLEQWHDLLYLRPKYPQGKESYFCARWVCIFIFLNADVLRVFSSC